jgi:hypothetical protein
MRSQGLSAARIWALPLTGRNHQRICTVASETGAPQKRQMVRGEETGGGLRQMRH